MKDILKTIQIGEKIRLKVLRENKEFETEIILQSKNDWFLKKDNLYLIN